MINLAFSDFEQTVEKIHFALKEFYKGNPEPYNRLFSNREDISLLGAQGGTSVGPEDVKQHLTSRASWFKEGQNVRWERVIAFSTHDLGYIVEIERFDVKMADTNEIANIALRVTTILRCENNEWKIIHRIADPLISRIDTKTYLSLAKQNIKLK